MLELNPLDHYNLLQLAIKIEWSLGLGYLLENFQQACTVKYIVYYIRESRNTTVVYYIHIKVRIFH